MAKSREQAKQEQQPPLPDDNFCGITKVYK
jgi:hypothetical protein